jgi:hypothetical protein
MKGAQMARGIDPIERDAEEVADPGEPGPRTGFTVPQAVDPGEPEGVPSGEEEEGEGEDGLELPEGTVLLYDEEGNPFLGIPIDPSDVPEDPEG